VICGLGPSGVPHCTPSIELLSNDGRGGLAPRWAHGLLVLEPVAANDWHDAAAEASPCRDGCDLPPRLRELAGRHRVSFP
jgi:hypothetical protein